MHLKRIELIGFKSFADKTVISFDKGVTAIVGPNGCGKSNITDAIRWVLGERSYKMLRGGKMEDMIFNGTEFRKPQGYCEVSMVFDNTDKALPVEFTEVEITRKYFRGGESAFFINRTPCRQKDVYDVLMDTGVGSNTYSMVEQGRIDYIVRASAEERRFLIEEAAGISKYKNKKEEALRKLERTENNLLRINDIVAEVEKNIKYAERQAKKAERYKERFDMLRRLETYKAFEEIDAVKQERTEREEKKERLQREQAALTENVQQVQRAVQEQTAEIEALNQLLGEKEAERYQVLNEHDKLKSKIEFNMIRVSELKARTDINRKNLEETAEKIRVNTALREQKENEYAAFLDEKAAREDTCLRQQETLAALNGEIDALTDTLNGCENEHIHLNAQIAQANNDVQVVHIESSKLEHQIKRLVSETEKLLSQKKEHERALIDRQTALDLERGEFSLFRNQYEKMKALKNEREQELSSVREAVLNKKVIHKEIEARLRVLEELEKSYNGFKDGAKAALQRKDENDPLFASLSTLVNVLNVHEGYENAIQAVLADKIYSVVARSHKEAYDVIKYLKEHNLGQITILVNREDSVGDDIAVPYDPAFILGRAIDFVTVTEENRSILEELFQRTLIIADSIDEHYEEVIELSRDFRLVTRDGVVIGPAIYMSGGSESENNAEMLTRDRKIKELRERSAELDHEQRRLTSHENALVGQLTDIRVALERYEQSFYDRKIKIETAEQISHSVKDLAERVAMEIALLERERAEAQEAIARLAEERAEKEKRRESLEQALAEAKKRWDEEKAHLQRILPEKEAMQMECASSKAQISALEEKDQFLQNALNTIRQTIEDDTVYSVKMDDEIIVNEQLIETLQAENTQANEAAATHENTIRHIELELSRMQSDRDEANIKLHSIQDNGARASTDLENCREELHETSMKIMGLSYRESAIHDRLVQTYRIELNDVDRTQITITDEEKETMDELIGNLRSKVEAMGAVNLMAIDEYDSLKERYEFLTTNKNDLEQARLTLLEAIRKINRTTRKLFIDVFMQVKTYFNDYYTTLFKGGHAEIILLDPENPLESGIDIFVRPPGKKLQNISLLSGGEKALTAIALLFAVFKVKPSPYCVLDEVDAPLDEANIDRFLTVLQDFLKTSQFLIVTHNRKTIKMADTLFGITMEEAGVSKVVSVKLGEEDSYIDKDTAKHDKRTSIYKPKKSFNTEKIAAMVGEQSA